VRCDDRFGEGQETQLVQAVQRLEGTILIAWSHEGIPKIVSAMQIESPTPQEWPDERFDMVWVLDRSPKKTTFLQVPQLLLARDDAGLVPIAKSA
jgi:hypothetical protein